MKILPIWQPIGFSTHLISQKVGEKYGVKTSHTGTLDPMAEGVIIVLLGEERLNKFEYARWPKSYDFDIIFGFSTDSYDGLGMIESRNFSNIPSQQEINDVLISLVGRYMQTVPPLSTRKVAGKHLHEYYRAGIAMELPEKKGEIYKLELKRLEKRDFSEIVQDLVENISLVTGDFRQEEIIRQWEKEMREKIPKITIAHVKTSVSKGIYIRSLVQDITKNMGTIGFAHNIIRTKNGKYGQKDCQTLENIFGQDFKKVYDFHSKFKSTMVK